MDQELPYAGTRRFARGEMRGRVMVFHGGVLYFGAGLEIGEGGMLFHSDHRWEVGDSAEVSFILPDGSYVGATGKILYVLEVATGFKVGFSFDLISMQNREMIADFVRQQRIESSAGKGK